MPEEQTTAAAADAAMDAALAESIVPLKKNTGTMADAKIAELERRAQEEAERALRAQAELENYRKRAQRELADERRFAVIPLVRDLLPVVDNLERAMEAASNPLPRGEGGPGSPGPGEGAGLLAGVKMVAMQLESVLKQHQCLRIETVGAAFDPNLHQAIAQEPSDQYPAGTVTRAAQSGFKLHDRVIRPAQVFVSTGPAAG